MIVSQQTDTDERLETPRKLAKRVGLSERQVRHLIQTRQLEHVMIGCRFHIPVGACSCASFRQTRCSHAQTQRRAAIALAYKAQVLSISPGQNAAAAASARLARQTANKLKSLSRNGCSTEDGETAQVIPLQSS